MSKPINEFAQKYAKSGTARFHMPGHKGVRLHGMEELDITEIKGADYLFEPSGIIARSEEQTAKAFGTAKTLYSTEGSSLCIKTMLGIVNQRRKRKDRKMLCAAPRNVHKAFINACILLDIEVRWIYPANSEQSLCVSGITAQDVDRTLTDEGDLPDCVYVTSPDYTGSICDIAAISAVCRERGVVLLCDNAHGAYLNFLPKNLHPIHLGAHMCADSAHKTLPCYTGGAYLHIAKSAPKGYTQCAKDVMSLFASTSPSYLIMQSLDICSDYIAHSFREELLRTVKRAELCKERLKKSGWVLTADEPCKITVSALEGGYEGGELGNRLREYGIEAEYTDYRYLTLMVSPFNSEEDFKRLERAMSEIDKRERLFAPKEEIPRAVVRMGIRQAAFSDYVTLPIDKAQGRICAVAAVCCQPSVPVVVSGEEITADVIKILKRYGILRISVV